MAKEKGAQGPVFNVVLPNNFGMYPDFPYAHAPAIQPPQPAPTITAPGISTSLIPTNYVEGSKIDLPTFCEIYTLADSIKEACKKTLSQEVMRFLICRPLTYKLWDSNSVR